MTNELPKVYIGGTANTIGDIHAFAVAEDGEYLAGHICSNTSFIRFDVHDRRPNTYTAKFGGHTPGVHYELVTVSGWSDVPDDVRAANAAWADSTTN